MIAGETVHVFRENISLECVNVVLVAVLGGGGEKMGGGGGKGQLRSSRLNNLMQKSIYFFSLLTNPCQKAVGLCQEGEKNIS